MKTIVVSTDNPIKYSEGCVDAARTLLEGVVRLTGTDNLDCEACVDLIRQDLRTRASTDNFNNECFEVVLTRLERVVRAFVKDRETLRKLAAVSEVQTAQTDPTGDFPRSAGQRDVYERFTTRVNALANKS